MKTILLWDPRFPDLRPARLSVDDAVASAAVRAGVAAAANPAEAGALGSGAALDPGLLTEVVLQHGTGSALRRVFLPYSVVLIGAVAGVLASIGTPITVAAPAPIAIARQAGVRADAVNTLASQETWLGAPFDHVILFAEQSNAANPWAENLAFTQSEIAKWQGAGKSLKWAFPLCTGQAGEGIAATIAGTFDTPIRAMLQAINDVAVARGDRPWIRPGWEMNLLTAYPWCASFVSRADYIAAFRRIAAMAKAINPNFVVEFVVSWRKDSGVDGREMWPGADAADTVGIDAYCLTQDQSSMTAADHASYMFAAPFGINFWRDFAVAQGKPFSIPEWATNYENPFYVQMIADFIRANNVPYHSYWDQNNGAFTCKLSTDQWPNAAYAYVRNFGPFTISSWALSAAPGAALIAPIAATKAISKIEIVSADAAAFGINVQAAAQAGGTRRVTVRATDERGLTATRSVALTWQNGTIWRPDTYFGGRLVDWYDASDASTLQRHIGAIKFINSKIGGRQALALAAGQRPTYSVVNGRPMMALAGAQALVQADLTGTPAAQAAVVHSSMVTTGAGAANFTYFVADTDGTGGSTNTRSLGYNANNLRVQGSSAIAGDALVGAERSVIASFGAGATSAVRSVVDGAAAKTGSVSVAATTYTKRVLGATGSASNNVGNYYTGALAEHYVVSGTVTVAEEDMMAGYNMWKAIAESSAAFQASASAYKANPPMIA